MVDKRLFVFAGGDGPNYYNDLYIFDTSEFFHLDSEYMAVRRLTYLIIDFSDTSRTQLHYAGQNQKYTAPHPHRAERIHPMSTTGI